MVIHLNICECKIHPVYYIIIKAYVHFNYTQWVELICCINISRVYLGSNIL